MPRIQLFMWKCMHQSIGVKECLANRGIPLDTTCPVCHFESESITYALRDCSLVKPLWLKLGANCLQPTFFSQGIIDWLISNVNLKSSQCVASTPWNIAFSFTIWLIWKQRNQAVFENESIHICSKLFPCKLQSSIFVLCNLFTITVWF